MADIVFTGETPSEVIGIDQMPNNVDLKLYKGDYYEFFVSLLDANNQKVNLRDDFPKAQIRENFNGDVVVEFDTSVDEDGDIRVYLSSTNSSQLSGNKDYIWDLQTTNYKGDVKTWLAGDIDVVDEVTR